MIMSIIRIDFHPSRRKLAVFGVVWLLFFAVVGFLVLYRGGPWTAAVVLWTLSTAVPAIGWLLPPLLRIVYLAMACLAFPVGFLVGHLALTGIYYLVLTPTGLLLRAFGYDPMNRRFDADAESYWIPRSSQEAVERYFRQF